MAKTSFSEIFKVKKPIIGMIHLSGNSDKEIHDRALEELLIYQEEEVDAAIIEDYHAPARHIPNILASSKDF